MSNVFGFVKNLFAKKEEQTVELPDRVQISYTEEAKERGILDDFNKEVKRYKNGVVVEVKRYSIQTVLSMKKVYSLPILDLTTSKEEDYKFDEVTALHGEIKRIVRI